MKRTITLLVVALMAAACSGSGAEVEGSWQLTSGTVDGTSIPILETHPITISFDGNEVSGTASCNSYGGSFEKSGETISFGNLAMTEMACHPPETMEAESMFGEALGRVDTFDVDGSTLTLTADGVELIFEATAG